jgi:hypothetical protein
VGLLAAIDSLACVTNVEDPMLGPSLNHRLYPSQVRDRISRELNETEATIGTEFPAWLEILRIGKRYFPDMERGEASVEFLCALMMEHWVPRCDPTWDKDAVRRHLNLAMADYWMTKECDDAREKARRQAKDAARRKALAEQAAKEMAAKEQRKKDAQLNNAIAKGFGITLRHARNLRKDGTTSPDCAARLAKILGTDPETHLRTVRRRVRDIDLVQIFMGIPHNEATFARFVSDRDEVAVSNDLMEFLRARANSFNGREELQNLEDMIERVRILGFKSLSLETAEEVWKLY